MAMLTMPSCKEYARCMREAKVCLVVFGTELCDESDNIFLHGEEGPLLLTRACIPSEMPRRV